MVLPSLSCACIGKAHRTHAFSLDGTLLAVTLGMTGSVMSRVDLPFLMPHRSGPASDACSALSRPVHGCRCRMTQVTARLRSLATYTQDTWPPHATAQQPYPSWKRSCGHAGCPAPHRPLPPHAAAHRHHHLQAVAIARLPGTDMGTAATATIINPGMGAMSASGIGKGFETREGAGLGMEKVGVTAVKAGAIGVGSMRQETPGIGIGIAAGIDGSIDWCCYL